MLALVIASSLVAGPCGKADIYSEQFGICYRNAPPDFDQAKFEERLRRFGLVMENELGISAKAIAKWYRQRRVVVRFDATADIASMQCTRRGRGILVTLKQWDALRTQVHEFMHVVQLRETRKCIYPSQMAAHAEPPRWFVPIECDDEKCFQLDEGNGLEEFVAFAIVYVEENGDESEYLLSAPPINLEQILGAEATRRGPSGVR